MRIGNGTSSKVPLGLHCLLFSIVLAHCSFDGNPNGLERSEQRNTQTRRREIDFGAVVERAHFAFHEINGEFHGGDSRYTTLVDVSGRLRITPFDYREQSQQPVQGPTVEFTTQSIHRGTDSENMPQTTPSLDGEGRVLIDHQNVREELQNTRNGVEQSWTFRQMPEGQGDLVVTIAVQGAEYVGASSTGLHFQDRSTELGLRYGIATWIDSRGDETVVYPVYENNTLVIRVPESVVETSAYPVVLDPLIGPERQVNTPTVGSASESQSQPRVATDNEALSPRALVVWSDNRGGNSDIFGCRIDLATPVPTVLDPTGIVISSGPINQIAPSVAYGVDRFLVAWQHGGDAVAGGQIRVAQVIPSTGSVVNPEGIVVDSLIANLSPVITSDAAFDPATNLRAPGTGFAVAWRRAASIIATPLTVPGGVTTLGGQIVVASTAASDSTLAMAWNGNAQGWGWGNQFILVWSDIRRGILGQKDLFGARLTFSMAGPTLTNLDPSGAELARATDTAFRYPGLACTGYSQCLLAWQTNYATTGADVQGRRLSPNSAAWNLGASFNIENSTFHEFQPQVATDTYNYFVVYESTRTGSSDVRLARVSGTGTTPTITFSDLTNWSGQQLAPSAVFTRTYWGTDYYVVFSDNASPNDQFDITGGAVESGGSMSFWAVNAISRGARRQSDISFAYNGNVYLAVWTEYINSGDQDIYAVRVGIDGTIIDTSPIVVASGPTLQYRARVASNGSDFLVVWEELASGNSNIISQRVSALGSLIGSSVAVSASSANERDPSVAWRAPLYTVVWSHFAGNFPDVRAGRVKIDGSLVDPGGFVVATNTTDTTPQPVIACSTTECQVVWNESFDTVIANATLTGSVVGTRNVVISTGGINRNATVAYGSGVYMAAWEHEIGISVTNIYGARINSAGGSTVPTVFTSSPLISDQRSPWINHDGQDFGLVWQDSKFLAVDGSYHVFANRISPSQVVTGTDLQVSPVGRGGAAPSIIGFLPGKFIVGYHRYMNDPGIGANRVVARTVEF